MTSTANIFHHMQELLVRTGVGRQHSICTTAALTMYNNCSRGENSKIVVIITGNHNNMNKIQLYVHKSFT